MITPIPSQRWALWRYWNLSLVSSSHACRFFRLLLRRSLPIWQRLIRKHATSFRAAWPVYAWRSLRALRSKASVTRLRSLTLKPKERKITSLARAASLIVWLRATTIRLGLGFRRSPRSWWKATSKFDRMMQNNSEGSWRSDYWVPSTPPLWLSDCCLLIAALGTMGYGCLFSPPGLSKPSQSFWSCDDAPPVLTQSFHLDQNAMAALVDVHFHSCPMMSYDVQIKKRPLSQRSPWFKASDYLTIWRNLIAIVRRTITFIAEGYRLDSGSEWSEFINKRYMSWAHWWEFNQPPIISFLNMKRKRGKCLDGARAVNWGSEGIFTYWAGWSYMQGHGSGGLHAWALTARRVRGIAIRPMQR